MKIAIIGAGGAGLAAAKHSAQEGLECEVFEQTGLIGGTWNYTDKVGIDDDNGLPVHTSMYKGLFTNVPKELMYYPDFPYPDNMPSYIGQEKVLQYIHDYANHYNLFKHIRFYKHVTRVHPIDGERWEVVVKDLKTKVEETKIFDAVMVCQGNYSSPSIPKIPHSELFEGKTSHSHDYRRPDCFANKKVLVIGAGPSGLDIAKFVSSVARKVFLSHNLSKVDVPESVIHKPKVKEFHKKGVIFEDNTQEDVDEVIYCTGYIFTYKFLTNDCGIEVIDNWTKPLWKQIINIHHPTMGFIGKPFLVCCFPLFDVQVRFFLASLRGRFQLPSKAQMMQDLDNYMNARLKKGIPVRKAHEIGVTQGEYFEDLAKISNITPIPPVISKLYVHIKQRPRKLTDCFKIVDDMTFVQTA